MKNAREVVEAIKGIDYHCDQGCPTGCSCVEDAVTKVEVLHLELRAEERGKAIAILTEIINDVRRKGGYGLDYHLVLAQKKIEGKI